MENNSISNKVIVFSDTHFGVIHDPTENEKTNVTDLLNLLDLIENEIRPKTIVLLGDIFDLWRVEFEDAWDNAHDIRFFERLSNYVNKYKDKGAELIYIIGNHDHFLKEISYAKNSYSRYSKIMAGEKGQIDDELTNELKNAFNYENVKVYYPHYKMNLDFGTVYFDHGHYNTKEHRQLKVIIRKIYKYLAKYFSKSNIFDVETTKTTPHEVFYDIEGNFSAVFSLIYHSKLDDVVRGARDFIWRTHKMRWYFFSSIIGFIAPSLIYTIIKFGSAFSLSEQLIRNNALPYSVFAFFSIFVGKFGPRILGAFIPSIVTNSISSMRGQTVDKILPEIVKKNISCEKSNYTYLNLIKEIGNQGKEIEHYIFAHTHIAGKKFDKDNDLTIYNCGGWVEEEGGTSCTNSFILIDPDIKSDMDKIKVFHIDKRSYAECKFNEKGICTKSCKK